MELVSVMMNIDEYGNIYRYISKYLVKEDRRSFPLITCNSHCVYYLINRVRYILQV